MSLVSKYPLKKDNVIACAASDALEKDKVYVYFYPREGVTNIRYYETPDTSYNKNEYSHYREVKTDQSDVFNGYLKRFERETTKEKWVIVSFMEQDTLHISNPIRLKHQSTPTTYTDAIQIEVTSSSMPVFSWPQFENEDNKIFFQVVSDRENNLLSGTYTFDTHFQYYNTDNVVLNITRELPPPELLPSMSYSITLMGVSEDNWVNLFAQNRFTP
ncbi:hypothetical protein HN014_04975 [Aquimarina sp. TRL1]|nr:hypothetical protein HN014_04975 [Aquimarina sp. TRL1]